MTGPTTTSLGPDALAAAYAESRADLVAYVRRLVIRPEIAEEIAQEAALRLVTTSEPLAAAPDARRWLFRVASRLGIDHLRSHSTSHEHLMSDARARGEADAAFVEESRALVGSPEMRTIAREHLAICFSCTIRRLAPERAAALLLVEVYDFSVQETAEMLGLSYGQAKHAIHEARARLTVLYSTTCALVHKGGVCYQCSELSEFFTGKPGDPLAGSTRDVSARLALIRRDGASAPGPWHRMLLSLISNIMDAGDRP